MSLIARKDKEKLNDTYNVSLAVKKCVVKTDGAILSGVDPIFTITGGPVRCKIVGLVTELVVGASNLRLQHITTSPAATVNLNAGAVAVDDDAVGTFYYNSSRNRCIHSKFRIRVQDSRPSNSRGM